MNNTTIPLEFETYLQSKIADGLAPDMNEMVFAYIPNLDPTLEIDRSNGLPDVSQWVHQENILQAGKIDNNALAYSSVIAGVVPEFTFNAIYIHDKNESNSCGVVVHKADETKENGMTITRTLVQEYDGAASTAEINIDAETWQIDFSARLLGMEENHRLTCIDNYGNVAFIDGFDVTNTTGDEYEITAGLAYISGLRAITNSVEIKTITTKPSNLYIDVHRKGTTLSKHENEVLIVESSNAESDYIDSAGYQHYVAKIAVINADGSISELKTQQTGELERADNAATNDDIGNESTERKHVKLTQLWLAITNKITAAFTARTIETTSPLQGGGNLSEDRTLSIQSATTEQAGAVKLNNSVTSSSETTAATAKAVKEAYDLADGALHEMAHSINENGYIKLSNGLIMQWGTFKSTGDIDQAILFPIEFTNAVFSVSNGGGAKGGTGLLDDTGAGDNMNWTARFMSKTGFSADRDDNVDDDVYFSYFAIGI